MQSLVIFLSLFVYGSGSQSAPMIGGVDAGGPGGAPAYVVSAELSAVRSFLRTQRERRGDIRGDTYVTVGFEFQFATCQEPAEGEMKIFFDELTHVELARTDHTETLPFLIETDSGNDIEIVTPPFLFPVASVKAETLDFIDIMNKYLVSLFPREDASISLANLKNELDKFFPAGKRKFLWNKLVLDFGEPSKIQSSISEEGSEVLEFHPTNLSLSDHTWARRRDFVAALNSATVASYNDIQINLKDAGARFPQVNIALPFRKAFQSIESSSVLEGNVGALHSNVPKADVISVRLLDLRQGQRKAQNPQKISNHYQFSELIFNMMMNVKKPKSSEANAGDYAKLLSSYVKHEIFLRHFSSYLGRSLLEPVEEKLFKEKEKLFSAQNDVWTKPEKDYFDQMRGVLSSVKDERAVWLKTRMLHFVYLYLKMPENSDLKEELSFKISGQRGLIRLTTLGIFMRNLEIAFSASRGPQPIESLLRKVSGIKELVAEVMAEEAVGPDEAPGGAGAVVEDEEARAERADVAARRKARAGLWNRPVPHFGFSYRQEEIRSDTYIRPRILRAQSNSFYGSNIGLIVVEVRKVLDSGDVEKFFDALGLRITDFEAVEANAGAVEAEANVSGAVAD